jgi:flagellum-specific peptidoglycan hydrolase FlgJ
VIKQQLSPAHHHHRRMRHRHKTAHAASQSNAAFLKTAIPASQQSERESGVPASITLAQACIESGWGHHHIGIANNFFGIKAPLIHGQRHLGTIAIGYVEVPTKEYDSKHKLYEVVDAFRQYAAMTDSFRDHGIWIRDNRNYPGRSAPTRAAGTPTPLPRHCRRAVTLATIIWFMRMR